MGGSGAVVCAVPRRRPSPLGSTSDSGAMGRTSRLTPHLAAKNYQLQWTPFTTIKIMFLHVSVCPQGGWVSAPLHAGIHPPGQTPPLHSACWGTVNKRAVRIPLECNLVFKFNFWRSLVFSMGPLIPVLDICPGFYSQGGSLTCLLSRLHAMDFSVIPADLLTTSMAAKPFGSIYLYT